MIHYVHVNNFYRWKYKLLKQVSYRPRFSGNFLPPSVLREPRSSRAPKVRSDAYCDIIRILQLERVFQGTVIGALFKSEHRWNAGGKIVERGDQNCEIGRSSVFRGLNSRTGEKGRENSISNAVLTWRLLWYCSSHVCYGRALQWS